MSTEAAEAAALPPEGEEAPKKKSKKKLILIMVGVVLLVVAVGGVLVVKRLKHRQAELSAMTGTFAEKSTARSVEHPPVFFPLDNFTVNLTKDTEDARYLQLSLVLEVSNLKASEIVKNYLPIIRSRILLLISSKSADELNTLEGKKHLAKELLTLARAQLPDFKEDEEKNKGIREIYFSAFVVQ